MSEPIRIKCICAKHRSAVLEFEIVGEAGLQNTTLIIVTPCEECAVETSESGPQGRDGGSERRVTQP